MLRHAVGRNRPHQIIERQSIQLQLPWLCPALLRCSRSISSGKSKTSHTQSRISSPTITRLSEKRHLASAATAVQEAEDSYIPFGTSIPPSDPHSPVIFRPPGASLWISEPVIVDQHGDEGPSRVLRRQLAGDREIGGNRSEIQSTFEACLQVRQFRRGRSLANRLAKLYAPNSPEIATVFNRYLRALTADLTSKQRSENMDLINACVEVDMKKAKVEASSHTYALMIKAALYGLQGSKRDRTVRRYWNIVKESELEGEVAGLPNILTDYDLGTISEICPMELDTEISQESLLEASEEDELEEAERTEAPPLPVSVSQELYLREMNQKGEGMTALKKSLSMFSDPSPLSHEDLSTSNATSPKRGEQYHTARQLRLERDAFESATERWRKEQEALQKHNVASDRQLNTLHARLFHWQQKLAQRLKEELLLCDIADSKQEALTPTEYQRREYGPFLRLVNPDQLAALTILTVFQNFSKIGVSELMKLSNVLVNVSRAVEAESVAEALSKSLKQNYGKKYLNRLITRSINRLSMKGLLSKARVDVDRMKERFEHYDRRFAAANLQAWPASIHAKVGAALCSHLFETATVTIYKEDPSTGKQLSNVQAVFRKITKYDKGRRRTLVQLHPVMVEKLAKEPPISLLAKQVPMITKPRPWTSFLEGGYLTTPTGFLRVKDSELDQRKYAEAAIERGDLEGYFTGLNILGETGWKVNADVFQVMREAWNTGQAIANLAPENPPIEMPPRPADGDMLGYRQWAHEVTKLENKRSGFHSERCFQNFQMEIARALLNETFYLPHNIDFRGRAYPIPPYFHQMCADHCRGLLLFAKGKELGVHGLRWLKIHLANVYGYDKASLAEREAFADRHLDEIRDSTDHPLDGRRWWLDAEDPWQCLATSFELRKALDSPDPTKYVSHIPVHQDGSCNGLQHYAALGGDIEGAQQVNLEPGDRPSDVYSGVAELVKAEISQDMEEGVEYAKILNGKVTRKVVKQTVMTNVYGVTFMGAMKQVRSQIEDLYPELEGKALQYSAYIAKKIFRALGTLFSGAHNIQFWLGDCANRINSSLTQDQLEGLSKRYRFDEVERDGRASKLTTREAAALMKLSFRCSVTWTTPLKLPVVQPYRDAKPKRVFTRLQTVMISAPTLQDNVHKRRQLQAFPPNFIHSLDATHMMLSAVKCNEMGMTFSAVHDSFWTHAADVDQMNRLLRDEFIRMHSENVIGRLAAEFKARYGNNIYRATIPGGTDLAEKILKWKTDYAATLGLKIRGAEFKVVEILIEHKRQKLLRSSDPQDQKEGAAMETAASIFEAEGHGDASLLVKSSLGQVNLGHVPKVTSKQTLKTALTKTEDMAEDVDLARSILPGTVDDPELLDDELICDLKQTINTSSSAMNGGKETRGRKPKKTTEQQTEQQAEQMEQKTEQKAKNKGGKRIHIWLPLRIPDIPQRGNWDVHRIQQSPYFFS